MKQEPYHYLECGLDNIWLLNGVTITEYDGEQATAIDDVDGLHIAIATDLIKMPRELTGKELRFLRKELDLSQKSLAGFLGREEQAVARWEKDETHDPIADRLIRILWLDVHRKISTLELLQGLEEADKKEYTNRHFQESEDGWRPVASRLIQISESMSAMELLQGLQELDKKEQKKRSFQESDEGWRPAA